MADVNADVLVGRCQQGRGSFGLRVEEVAPASWRVTWSFVVTEVRASAEGYGGRVIHGTFEPPQVSCCPHCNAGSFAKCGCGKVTCWNYAPTVTCMWCGLHWPVGGPINSISTSGDA